MRRLSLPAATAFGTLTLPWLAWADSGGEGGHGYGHMMGGGAHWIIGPIMMVLFVVAIVVVVVLVVRWLGGGGVRGARGRPKAALDILEERFARGEIDKDEFEARRQALRD